MKYIKTFESQNQIEKVKTLKNVLSALRGSYEEGKSMTRGVVNPQKEYGGFLEKLIGAVGYLQKMGINWNDISQSFDIRTDIEQIMKYRDQDQRNRSKQKIEQKFNQLVQDFNKYIMGLEKPQEKKPIEEKPIDKGGKEMSKKYPKMTVDDAKDISNELDRLVNKYPDNDKIKALQNSWYEGDDKDSDYDGWEDKIRDIFKK